MKTKILTWIAATLAELGAREALVISGLILIGAGLSGLFSVAVAAIVVGAVLLYLGLWHSALFAKVMSKVVD